MSKSPEESVKSDHDDGSRQIRKRHNSDADGGPASKRGGDDHVQLKMLLPRWACGVVIGKGGEVIAKLQEENGIRMLVSKNQDTYPGTAERVCRMIGPIPSILSVFRHIYENAFAKQAERDHDRDIYTNKHHERSKQVKIAIPNECAGVVIGKGGDQIKEMHELTGARVDVSKREREPNLPERIVTISADEVDKLLDCVEVLLQKLSQDKNASIVQTLNYAEMFHMSLEQAKLSGSHGPNHGDLPPPHPPLPMRGATRDLFGSPMADGSSMGSHAFAQEMIMRGAGLRTPVGGSTHNISESVNGRVAEVPMSVLRGASTDRLLAFLTNLQNQLRNLGYSNTEIVEIMGAMQTLARHNVLGLGLGFGLAAADNQARMDYGRRSPVRRADEYERRESAFRDPERLRELSGNDERARYSEKDILNFLRDDYASKSGGYSSRGAAEAPAGGHSGYSGYSMRGESTGATVRDYSAEQSSTTARLGEYLKMFSNSSSSAKTAEYSSRGREPDPRDPRRGGFNRADVGSPEPSRDRGESVSEKVEVPDSLVGVILGRGGNTLAELQRYSGTTMSVSRKGEYGGNGDNRLVSIVGAPDAVSVAKRLVERRIAEEKFHREQRATMA